MGIDLKKKPWLARIGGVHQIIDGRVGRGRSGQPRPFWIFGSRSRRGEIAELLIDHRIVPQPPGGGANTEPRGEGSLGRRPYARSRRQGPACKTNGVACDGVGRKNASSERERVLLRLLLVSGNRSDVACPTDYSVHQLKQKLLNDWPKGKQASAG